LELGAVPQQHTHHIDAQLQTLIPIKPNLHIARIPDDFIFITLPSWIKNVIITFPIYQMNPINIHRQSFNRHPEEQKNSCTKIPFILSSTILKLSIIHE
jgi:hypothetical protein